MRAVRGWSIPDPAAAYAAALHDAGVGTWGEIAGHLRMMNMGAFAFDELAKVATAWARNNVEPAARKKIRALAARKSP